MEKEKRLSKNNIFNENFEDAGKEAAMFSNYDEQEAQIAARLNELLKPLENELKEREVEHVESLREQAKRRKELEAWKQAAAIVRQHLAAQVAEGEDTLQ